MLNRICTLWSDLSKCSARCPLSVDYTAPQCQKTLAFETLAVCSLRVASSSRLTRVISSPKEWESTERESQQSVTKLVNFALELLGLELLLTQLPCELADVFGQGLDLLLQQTRQFAQLGKLGSI